MSPYAITWLSIILCIVLSGGSKSYSQRRTASGYASATARIYIDGEYEDWEGLAPLGVDTSDSRDKAVRIDRLWAAHSNRYLFLRVELSRAINLQEDNELTLYLDTDDRSTTGRSVGALGAEVVWNFGQQSGRVKGTEINHATLGLQALPTVRSDKFEVAIDRNAQLHETPLFQTDSLRMALCSGGDCRPDEKGLGYVFTEANRSLEAPTPVESESADVRVFSQNAKNQFETGRNAIFKESRQPPYRRILAATGPDVVALQEVYDQRASEVEQVAEGPLGLSEDWTWRKEGPDLVIGSRFPIVETHAISGFRRFESGAFLLDAREALGTFLIVVVMHPPCCNRPGGEGKPSRNVQRQKVVDGVAAFLREVTKGKGPFDVPSETPIAVVGDMNFVGDPQQPRTLRTGEIVHTDEFGPAAGPDWDTSELLDVNPRQTGSPLHTTWMDSTSAYLPGRLDYAYVTDSVVDVTHAFVLNTEEMSRRQRSTYDVKRDDTARASDHLPIVIDLAGE